MIHVNTVFRRVLHRPRPHWIEIDIVLDERHELSPDALFDRRWALALLDQAISRLESEYAGGNFNLLKECLTAGRGETRYAELAEAIGTNEGRRAWPCIACASPTAR